MRNWIILIATALCLLISVLKNESALIAQTRLTVKGIVYHDKNENGIYDSSVDKPLKKVAVSNGRDVAVTNRKGMYELPLRENAAVFVIKPRNWMVPTDERQMPRFYYMQSSSDISGTQYKGLEPTGRLPQSVDFPLYRSKEPDRMDILVFGDMQPRDEQEIYYMSNDVLPELTGVNASFGVTLGDVVFNDLNLFGHLTATLSTIGIPWWYVPGNHDIDHSAGDNQNARGAWYSSFGPSYYSFTYGPAHFIVLDNIRWVVEKDKRYYQTGLGKDQMEFLRNEINRLDSDQLLVLLAHIPFAKSTEWEDEAEQKAFFELIAGHTCSVSLVAHTHRHYHHFIGEEEGYPGKQPHHMISVGTVCGAWWTGAPNEYGIPHTLMSDGTPNGYAFLHIDKNEWELSWKAAGKPAGFQMHIDAPDFVSAGNTDEMKVTANIFNALPSADVKMRIGTEGKWISMERIPQYDPARVSVMEREQQLGQVPWRNLGNAAISEHIWEARQKIEMNPGIYVIEVISKDEWHEYEGRKLIHVK